MKIVTLVALLITAVGVCGCAQVPPGIGSASFVRVGVDARALGMGGAFVAVTSGGPIALYNPAALALARKVDVGAMYAAPFGAEMGITYQCVSAVMPLRVQTESVRGLGAAVTWMGVQISDIPVWDEDDPGNGTLFTATDSIYLASLGMEVADGICVGAAAKLYRTHILDGRAEGAGIDAGIIASTMIGGMPVTFALNSMDIGRTLVKWSGTAGNPDNYVPWVNKCGATVALEELSLLVAADFDWAVGRPAGEQVLRAGFEWKPAELFALRGGWKSSMDGRSTVSAGIGIRLLGTFSFDYAYVVGADFDAAHFGSFHIEF